MASEALFDRVAVLEDVSYVTEGETDAEMKQLERAHHLQRDIEALGASAPESMKEEVADIMGVEDYEKVADTLEARRRIDESELPDPDEDAIEDAKALNSDLGFVTSDGAKQDIKDQIVELLGVEDYSQAVQVIKVRG